MKHGHTWLPYENLAHYEVPPIPPDHSSRIPEEKLHCTHLITKICAECGEVQKIEPVAPEQAK